MKKDLRSISRRKCATGSSLIEVLIALLLLSIGVLGAASMQLNALKYNQFAMVRSAAVLSAYSIVDSMRANRAGLLAGDYTSSTPTAGTIASIDLQALKQSLLGLPDAASVITSATVGLYQQVTVTVSWSERRAAQVNSGQSVDTTTAPRGSVTVVTLL